MSKRLTFVRKQGCVILAVTYLSVNMLIIARCSPVNAEALSIVSCANQVEMTDSIDDQEGGYYDKGIALLADAYDYKNELTLDQFNNKIYRAMQLFEKILEVKHKSSLAHKGIASAYILLNRHNQAIEEYKKVLEIDYDDFLTLFSIGFEYKEIKDTQNAKEYFNKAKIVADQNHKLKLLFTEEYKKILIELR
jgi:tetratricopeptide (TPR) repeat protein